MTNKLQQTIFFLLIFWILFN